MGTMELSGVDNEWRVYWNYSAGYASMVVLAEALCGLIKISLQQCVGAFAWTAACSRKCFFFIPYHDAIYGL